MRSPLGDDENSGADWVAGGIRNKEFDCPVGHTFTFMGEDVYWVEWIESSLSRRYAGGHCVRETALDWLAQPSRTVSNSGSELVVFRLDVQTTFGRDATGPAPNPDRAGGGHFAKNRCHRRVTWMKGLSTHCDYERLPSDRHWADVAARARADVGDEGIAQASEQVRTTMLIRTSSAHSSNREGFRPRDTPPMRGDLALD